MLEKAAEWLTVSLRVIVPAFLVIVGAWVDDFTLLFTRLVDAKISEWNSVVWKQYAYYGRIYFLIVVFLVVIIQIVLEIYLFKGNRRTRDELSRVKRQNSDLLKEVAEMHILKDNVDSVIKLYLGAVA